MTDRDRRRYRKIFLRLWTNEVFQSLPDGEKVMTFYCLAGPQTNRCGLYKFSVGLAAEDLKASPDTVKRRLDRVCGAFGWEFDERAKVLWVPSWWTYNMPNGNENNLKGALSDLNEVPKTALIAKFCRNLVGIPDALRQLFDGWEALLTPSEHRSNTVPNTVRTQEKEKEKEKEQEQDEGATPNGDGAAQVDGKEIHRFLKGFCDLYAQHGGGAKYVVNHSVDVPLVRRLLRAHGVDRLLRLATVMLRVEDPFIADTDRGIKILSVKINWLEKRLAEAEARQRVAS